MRELLFKGQPKCGHLIQLLSAILFYNHFGNLSTGCSVVGSCLMEVQLYLVMEIEGHPFFFIHVKPWVLVWARWSNLRPPALHLNALLTQVVLQLLIDTRLMWTPRCYGQFSLSLALTLSLNWTHLIWIMQTLSKVPSVSMLTGLVSNVFWDGCFWDQCQMTILHVYLERSLHWVPFSGGVSLKEVSVSGGRLHLYYRKLKISLQLPGLIRGLHVIVGVLDPVLLKALSSFY